LRLTPNAAALVRRFRRLRLIGSLIGVGTPES
jgi:hypothetical protein